MTTNWGERRRTDWNPEALANLAGEKEGLHLEFKKPQELMGGKGKNRRYSRDLLRREVAETVSAFLNSDGGSILVGVQTERDRRRRKDETLQHLSKWTSCETLEALGISLSDTQLSQIVHSSVTPAPEAIRVHMVEVPAGDDVTSVFVIDVPASELGAHQSLVTKCYYRRLDGADVAMADHERRDVDARRAGPRLRAEVYLAGAVDGRIDRDTTPGVWHVEGYPASPQNDPRFRLGLQLSNDGRGTAREARVDIGIPKPFSIIPGLPADRGAARIVPNPLGESLLGSFASVVFSPNAQPTPAYLRGKVCKQHMQWLTIHYSGGARGGHPLWGGGGPPADLGTFDVVRNLRHGHGGHIRWIAWRAWAEGMPPVSGVAALTENEAPWRFTVHNRPVAEVAWAGEHEDVLFEETKRALGVEAGIAPQRVK